ncbi:MAG TPA: porphobilinogen synthase, partial [Saprospiraceae bacterium]|nr:porphobilinogen synthase [Saprospiraceae bacterium]
MIIRPRILRNTAAIRALVSETRLSMDDLIAPLFIVEGEGVEEEIPSLPNYFRRSLDKTLEEVMILQNMGVKAVLLFIKCKDELKDNEGTEALNQDGLMQRSIKAIKYTCPDMYIMTDIALDPYSSFGHDGIVRDGQIINDRTIDILAQMAVSHAEAGADMVAPSDMMDGRIGKIRQALENAQYTSTGIMS